MNNKLSSRKVIHQVPVNQIVPKVAPKVPSSATFIDNPIGLSHDMNDEYAPYQYTLLPAYQFYNCETPSPTSTHSDTSDMSPPPSPCYQPEWIYRRVKSPGEKVPVGDSFWPDVVRPRSKTDRSVPLLGHTNSRTHHARRRGPSVSSIPSVATASSTSSISKPNCPQAKSILTRTSSASTKNSLSKSVKFVDMPTVHYGYDNVYDDDSYDDCEIGPSNPPSPPISSKTTRFRGFKRYIWPRWLNQHAVNRPPISTPFPLGSVQPQVDFSDSASIRSTGSTKSERTRPTISGPFSLRSARSTESFRSTKSTNNSKLRALLGKMVP